MIFLWGGNISVNKGLWNLSLLLMILGVLIFLAGAYLRTWRKRREIFTVAVDAVVVDIIVREKKKMTESMFANALYPVLQYYADGKLIKITYPRGEYPSRYKIGQKLSIAYDPARPERCIILRQPWRRYLPSLLCGAGMTLFISGVVTFILFASRT